MVSLRDVIEAIRLSPRVRGNHSTVLATCDGRRSIPACAGEPGSAATAFVLLRVYPRVCGGTQWTTAIASRINGLSPRVRGNPSLTIGAFRTPIKPEGLSPRVRGNSRMIGQCSLTILGLSPRVRGNPISQPMTHGLFVHIRSIPACAGEPILSRICHGAKPFRSVYPRVCGGTPSTAQTHAGHSGSIPACAGEPPSMLPPRPLNEPRLGLSPRVRGNHCRPVEVPLYQARRSIPACAGEP